MNDMIELIKAVWAGNTDADARQWPCLVGPTGSGKTARAKALARELGVRLVTLLPGTALPEDILGLPRVQKGVTEWSMPEWAAIARKEPCVILIDELDKARPETQAALLTLLSGLAVRDAGLHPQTRIICAMQPVQSAEWLSTETGRALSARLVFIPISYSRARLAQEYGLDADALTAALGVEESAEPPILPVPSDRQADYVLRMLASGADEKTVRAVGAGSLGPQRTDALLTAWQSRAPISARSVIDAIMRDPSVADTLSAAECIALAGDATIESTPAVVTALLVRIARVGTADDLSAVAPAISDRVMAENGGTTTIFRGSNAPAEDDARELARGMVRAMLELARREGASEDVINTLEGMLQ